MPKHQLQNRINNSQGKISALESINPTTEKCSIAEAQDKDSKVAIMNMYKDIKEDMSKYINEISDYTNSETL